MAGYNPYNQQGSGPEDYDVAGGVSNVAGGFAAGGPIGGLLAAAPEAYKLYQGFKQKRDAKRLAANRPQYEIPQAATEALNTQRSMALDPRMPGQQLAQQNLGRSTQRGLEAIREGGGSSAEIIAGATNLAGQEQNALNQQAQQAAGFQQQNQQNLVQGLNQYAGYQDQAQQYNKLQPHENQMQAKAALEEGSMQNIYGGVKGLASAGIESLPQKSFNPNAAAQGKGSAYDSGQLQEILKTLGY